MDVSIAITISNSLSSAFVVQRGNIPPPADVPDVWSVLVPSLVRHVSRSSLTIVTYNTLPPFKKEREGVDRLALYTDTLATYGTHIVKFSRPLLFGLAWKHGDPYTRGYHIYTCITIAHSMRPFSCTITEYPELSPQYPEQ